MAFNPFRGFRKHQKVLFAALTILCMLTFVMCSGYSAGENLISNLGILVGLKHRTDIVATMYGKDVSSKDIQDLRLQRRLADTYIRNVTEVDRSQLFSEVMDASRKWEQQQQQVLQQVFIGRFMARQSPNDRRAYFQSLMQLESLRFQFAAAKKTAEADQIRDLSQSLQRELSQMLQPRNQFYFGGTTSVADILDFMIWRHEADRRGIQLNRQEIGELVRREIDGRPIVQQRQIEQALAQQFRNTFSAETFRTALADEFRVRIVKSALVGSDPTASGYASTWATPYEFWQFYKENRTENTVAVLPIPARNKDFLAQVGQPPEKDLKELFEKYKDKEHKANSPDPGFEVPPRIEVEWVSAKADSEHYRKEAARVTALSQAALQVMAGGGQTMSGNLAAEGAAIGVPFCFDFSLIDKYERERYNLRNPSWNEEWSKFFNPRLHESSIRRVDNTVAALGQLLGGSATQAPVISSAFVFAESARDHESRDRAVIGLSTVLAGANPNPFLPAAIAYYGSPREQFIPLSEVKDEFAKKLQEDLAKKLVQADLGELQSKLQRLQAESRETPDMPLIFKAMNRPEAIAAMFGQASGNAGTGAPLALATPTGLGPAAINYVQARAHEALVSALAGPNPGAFLSSGLTPLEKIRKTVDEAVKSKGFEHGLTRQPDDRDTIADDPGLKPFREAFMSYRRFGEPKPKGFADQFSQFFQNPASYSPQPWPLGGDSDESFVFWKTNDKPAYVPTFAEVENKVKDWWQVDKARELAKKDAEDLKAKAQGKPDAEAWLKDGTKHSEPMFLLDDVAGLVKGRTPFSRGPSEAYQRYAIPLEKIEYPPDDLSDELVKMNEVGQVIVRSDRPKTTYYVFALVKRTRPSEFALYREYASGSESLLGNMEKEIGTLPDNVQAIPFPTAESFAGSSTLSPVNSMYSGLRLTFTSGPLKGQTQQIKSYDGETRAFSFSSPPPAAPSPWPSAPEVGDAFQISDALVIQLRELAHLRINEENRKQVEEGQRGDE
jgi:hypothetical protein